MTTVEKGHWYRFPDGKVVEVLHVTQVRARKEKGDTEPRYVYEAKVSVLDSEGAMTNVKFHFNTAFLTKYTERVRVAAPIAV
ncbi:MAG: hypothetical protein ACK5A0_11080 [Polaromonas sp.]|jgi:hypothetical protein